MANDLGGRTEDIAPILYTRIRKAFQNRIARDDKIQTFERKLVDKTATASEVFSYATGLGRLAAAVLEDVLDPENLPDGQLYWNIGSRTIKPLLQEVYKLVVEAADEQMRIQDEATGIRLNPIRPAFPEDRVDDLIFKLKDYLEETTDE